MQARKILHGRVLENLFLFSPFFLSYTSPCKIWNFLSPIAPLLKSFGKRQVHCRKEKIVFNKRNLENLGRPNLVSASRTPYLQSHSGSSPLSHINRITKLNQELLIIKLGHLAPTSNLRK